MAPGRSSKPQCMATHLKIQGYLTLGCLLSKEDVELCDKEVRSGSVSSWKKRVNMINTPCMKFSTEKVSEKAKQIATKKKRKSDLGI